MKATSPVTCGFTTILFISEEYKLPLDTIKLEDCDVIDVSLPVENAPLPIDVTFCGISIVCIPQLRKQYVSIEVKDDGKIIEGSRTMFWNAYEPMV